MHKTKLHWPIDMKSILNLHKKMSLHLISKTFYRDLTCDFLSVA